mmetsp:Transcript_19607/g.39946  ORF Transcript_19607/g.39946 Transcript_19607/m.39946 type:complete len:388 (+) Transcript_19607:247-1410(+)
MNRLPHPAIWPSEHRISLRRRMGKPGSPCTSSEKHRCRHRQSKLGERRNSFMNAVPAPSFASMPTAANTHSSRPRGNQVSCAQACQGETSNVPSRRSCGNALTKEPNITKLCVSKEACKRWRPAKRAGSGATCKRGGCISSSEKSSAGSSDGTSKSVAQTSSSCNPGAKPSVASKSSTDVPANRNIFTPLARICAPTAHGPCRSNASTGRSGSHATAASGLTQARRNCDKVMEPTGGAAKGSQGVPKTVIRSSNMRLSGACTSRRSASSTAANASRLLQPSLHGAEAQSKHRGRRWPGCHGIAHPPALQAGGSMSVPAMSAAATHRSIAEDDAPNSSSAMTTTVRASDAEMSSRLLVDVMAHCNVECVSRRSTSLELSACKAGPQSI